MFRCKILSFYGTWTFFTCAASRLYVTLCAALVLRQAAGKTHGNRVQTYRAARASRRSAAKVPAAEQKGMDHMNNFNLFTPTKVVFGKDTESQTGALVKAFGGQKVLLHYGSGSVIRSGLLDKIKETLQAEGIAFTELGGAVPNPRLALVYEGIALGQKEGVDFVLAVGGGSAIDSAKAIAYGLAEPEQDVCVALHHAKERALAVGERGVGRELLHGSRDEGERRAELMAHVGEEPQFGTDRLLSHAASEHESTIEQKEHTKEKRENEDDQNEKHLLIVVAGQKSVYV